jgi:Uma2 family endonuclease
MALGTGTVTAEQLARMPDTGDRYELVKGELRMMSPSGRRHGRVAMKLGVLLGRHVLDRGLGEVYAAETGFLLSRDPDTVRAPDVAFIAESRLQGMDEEIGYLPLAPDLVGEVVSPTDSFSQVQEKALMWIASGTKMVLVVDPQTRTLHVHRVANDIAVFDEKAVLDAGDIVPHWTLAVRELFA